MENNVNKKVTLDKKDLKKTFMMWWATTELSNSYDRLQGLAFCNALAKNLEKLYGKDSEEYKKALVRHMEFYNSEGITGSVIHGIALSMEEEKANGVPITGEVITGIKRSDSWYWRYFNSWNIKADYSCFGLYFCSTRKYVRSIYSISYSNNLHRDRNVVFKIWI